MSLAGAVLAALVSFVVGTVSIMVGVRLVLDRDAGFWNAGVTAVVGAVVWGVVSFFVGWIPFLGFVLMLLSWIAVLNWRYPGGWGTATAIAIVAWVVAGIIVYLLALANVVPPDVFGIPRV